jgi:diguanylate cyclase (GGDEF)-like protein
MDTLFKDLRRTGARWEVEHGLVADTATAINLNRLRVFGPVVAGINTLYVLAFLVQALRQTLGDPVATWSADLALTHLSMGLWMAAATYAARALRHAHRGKLPRLLAIGVVSGALLFSILVVSIDQAVSGNITTFLITCLLSSLAIYLRPLTAASIYLVAYAVFFWAIDSQPDATQLLSNRISGLAICGMGWALSFLLWRKFTTIALQQEQLDKLQLELQHKQKELERLTRLDGLTGLYNRNTFVELTRKELQRAQRQGSATALLLLDLDHFKQVNDTWGHPAGDAVLKHVAALVTSSIRSTDLAGRLGGEEFIVLLPGTSREAARKIAEKIRARLEATPTDWQNIRIAHTVSIGLSGTTSAEKQDFESLYTDGDKALYIAKQRGRNRVI